MLLLTFDVMFFISTRCVEYIICWILCLGPQTLVRLCRNDQTRNDLALSHSPFIYLTKVFLSKPIIFLPRVTSEVCLLYVYGTSRNTFHFNTFKFILPRSCALHIRDCLNASRKFYAIWGGLVLIAGITTLITSKCRSRPHVTPCTSAITSEPVHVFNAHSSDCPPCPTSRLSCFRQRCCHATARWKRCYGEMHEMA